MSEDRTPIHPLVAQLIEQSRRDLAFTTNALIEGLTRQAWTAEAELSLIREEVEEILSGPYMPTPARIMSALYPARHEVEDRIKQLHPEE